MTSSNKAKLERILYPKGTEFDKRDQLSLLLEEYKIFVDTSEKLVARRQIMNAFFLSLNGLLFSAIGVVARQAITTPTVLTGVVALSLVGIVSCIAWRRLINSYSQLNTGKFIIIHLLEQYLPAAPFKAEWKALGEGKDRKKYIPFTKNLTTIPVVFTVFYGTVILGSLISLYWV